MALSFLFPNSPLLMKKRTPLSLLMHIKTIEYVIGSKTAREAWLISVIAMLRFLVLCKPHRKLHAARVKISDDDFTIAALNGLPSKCDMIRTVLIARESSLSLKDFRPHLLVIETTAEARMFNGGRNDNSQFRPFSEFLGGSITSFKSNVVLECQICSNQQKYAQDLLQKAGMTTYRSCSTPYLHSLLVKRILRYIQGTLDYGLKVANGPWQLIAYSDADWAVLTALLS
ncbi:unnamed protein product [Prunus armeniaca]